MQQIALFLILAATIQFGPYDVELRRVIDGDTVLITVNTWPRQYINIKLRLDGIDAPELRGKCQKEKELAIRSAEALFDLLDRKKLKIYAVREGKYAGRVIGRLLADGEDVSVKMKKLGYAVAYDGKKRKSWCNN